MLLQDFQQRWADDFKKIKTVIDESLCKMDISVLHVGSTSVPGLTAKPIIDIDILYGPSVDFKEVKEGLEKIGYSYKGNQGIKEREVFKRSTSTKKDEILDFISHHLYVCPIHSEEFNRHILFRDFLIKNERERQQYQEIKRRIAEQANQDSKIYAGLKEVEAKGFIYSIIERAKKKG